MARDPSRIGRALDAALKTIFTLQRRRARRQGIRGGHCGAISFVQRFGDSLNLNLHFHCVIPDGVFVTEGVDVRFEALPAPTDAELDALLRKIARRLICQLRPPADAPEPDALDFLESAQHAALSDWQPARNDAPPKRKRHSAFVEGFSLHAGVHLHANDRAGLARLLAYGARGPIALERLGALPDGRLTYQLKRPLPDGRTELVLQPTELLRKLATLVPPPRRNLVRYHGLFAPHSALRAKVVADASACARDCSPDGPAPQPEPAAPAACAGSIEPRPPATTPPARARSRVPWAEVLSRVFKVDVLQCENCGGRMTVLAFLTERAVVKKILEHLGLPATGGASTRGRAARAG